MKLTRQQLDNLIIRQGRVLVKVDVLEKENTDSGIFIKAYADQTKADFAARCGIVVGFNKDTDIPLFNYDYHGECEIQIGDKVWWFKHIVGENLKVRSKDPKIFECEGSTYVLVPYKGLVMAEVNGERYGLNDFVICRPIKREVSTSLDLSMTELSKPLREILEVVYVPTGSIEYRDKVRSKVEVGDKVYLKKNGNMIEPLEDELNKTLDEMLYCVQSFNIMAKE